MTQRAPLPALDMAEITAAIAPAMERWRGARLLLTGASGFVGHWLTESFHHANLALDLGATLVAVAGPGEPPDVFAPHVHEWPEIRIAQADICRLGHDLESQGIELGFDAVIHGAIHVDATSYASTPLPTLDTAILGTREALELARRSKSVRFLYLSSGAVYGEQPRELEQMTESHPGAPDPANPSSAYAEGKRAGETLSVCYHRQHGLDVVIARLFSFVGPRLPLDRHFAVGNFIRDAIRGGPIIISGDGRPVRSYMYASDLTVALWALLANGKPGQAYNVGSDDTISIRGVAALVAEVEGTSMPVRVEQVPAPGLPPRYVPNTTKLRTELQVAPVVPLRAGIARSLAWERGHTT